jgi:hypothetical protein
MRTKTDNPDHVGKHKFTLAGLGAAPFRYLGMSESVITYPDGTTQAGGCCDYCGTGIRYVFHIASADGKTSNVGCDCITKAGDAGLMKAYKRSPQWRAVQREKRKAKADRDRTALKELLERNAFKLAALPHPSQWRAEKGETAYNHVAWMLNNAGASGASSTLRWTLRLLNLAA